MCKNRLQQAFIVSRSVPRETRVFPVGFLYRETDLRAAKIQSDKPGLFEKPKKRFLISCNMTNALKHD